jgi:hypothetical protein
VNSATPSEDRGAKPPRTTISNTELARFLAQLANLYASREFGNQALAAALRELASFVRHKDPLKGRGSRLRRTETPTLSSDEINGLRTLSQESVKSFLADENRTKEDLLALASLRFSMPVSQLRRMKTADVRQAITAAVLHESSIAILSEEADRDGSNRSS